MVNRMYSVTKTYTFDSAHRLVRGYEGKCAHVHGHTWQVALTYSTPDLNEYGFARDFAAFKPVKDWIDERLDHATLVCIDDEVLLTWLREEKQKHYVMSCNPTSENIAELLCEISHGLGIDVSTVEVHETCTSAARYTP